MRGLAGIILRSEDDVVDSFGRLYVRHPLGEVLA
jgi:hypothetical protein